MEANWTQECFIDMG